MAGKIGDMSHRIDIQSFSTATDGQGGVTTTWTTLKSMWADVEPIKGYERKFADRIEDVYTHKIIIRKTTGITTAMRVNFRGRIFQIKAIELFDRERLFWMRLLTEEKVGT